MIYVENCNFDDLLTDHIIVAELTDSDEESDDDDDDDDLLSSESEDDDSEDEVDYNVCPAGCDQVDIAGIVPFYSINTCQIALPNHLKRLKSLPTLYVGFHDII